VRTRILGPEEWSRVERETPMPLMPFTHPRNMAVCVVEGDGGIAATVSTLRVTHLEGLWVKPEFRGNAGVMRALLRQAWATAQLRDERWMFGGAEHGDAVMQDLNERIGHKIPMDLYAISFGGDVCRQR